MKFPALKAFGATFAYLARHGVDLVKALWLPAALLVALQLYALPPMFASLSSLLQLGDNPDPEQAAAALGPIAKWCFVLLVGSAIAYPMMTAASLKHVVRGESQSLPFYLRYGGDELRILAGYALLSVMVIVITIVGGLAVTVLALAAALALPQSRTLMDALGELAVNVAIIWFRLRLSVLYPAAMATGTIGFNVSWAATKGQTFSLFLFWLLIGVACLPVGLLMAAPFIGEFLPLFAAIEAAGEDKAAVQAAMVPFMEAFGRLFSAENPSYALFVALLFVSTVVSTAIINIAAGIAWRYLTDSEKPAEVASQRLAA